MIEINTPGFPSFPVLAGISTYADSAQLGYSVAQDVARLIRYAWLEKQAMELALVWLNPTPEWEVKEGLSLHLYLDAQHAGWIRERVSEMRNPAPRMDASPSATLQAFLDELLTAQDTLEKIVGLYGVFKPALLAAYRLHFSHAHPLVDHPTRRMLRMIIADEEEITEWGQAALKAVSATPDEQARAETWSRHLQAYLLAAGGVMGDEAGAEMLPPSRVTQVFQPDFLPKRDERFENQWNFVFPPHEVARMEGVPADEKTLALMCKRALEMDVPEAMARMMLEAKNQPWDYYLQMSRQLWDEARHAMMGTVYLEAHGVDWKRLPLHPGFALRLNQHMSAVEAHAVLYAIEQSLMPATTGKRYEWVISGESHDELAQYFQDYDWADEVLHVRIGRDCLLMSLKLSQDEAVKLGQRCATESEAALQNYEKPGTQFNWWPDFVRQVLGKESAVSRYSLGTADPVYRSAGSS